MTDKVLSKKIKKWERERNRYTNMIGLMSDNAPDVVKVKYSLIKQFLEDLEDLK